jgi:hypothetical protein
MPDLKHDLLKEILPVGMLERVRVNHFEKDPFVARQPLVKDPIALTVVHTRTFLDPTGGKVACNSSF